LYGGGLLIIEKMEIIIVITVKTKIKTLFFMTNDAQVRDKFSILIGPFFLN